MPFESEWFTVDELTVSDTAVRLGISNKPSAAAMERIVASVKGLDLIRESVGVPVQCLSGYRSQALNTQIGGSRDSWHCYGQGFDLLAPRFGTPLDLCRRIRELRDAGQLRCHEIIHEFGRWAHVAFAMPDEMPQDELFTYDRHLGKTRCRVGLLEVAR